MPIQGTFPNDAEQRRQMDFLVNFAATFIEQQRVAQERVQEIIKRSIFPSTFPRYFGAANKAVELAVQAIGQRHEAWKTIIATLQPSLDEALKASVQSMETITKALRTINAFSPLETASFFATDRVLFKSLEMGQAASTKQEKSSLPDTTVLRDLELESVPLSGEQTESTTESTTIDRVPLPFSFIRTIDCGPDGTCFETLPEEADLIDECIALYEPFKAGIFILVQSGRWIKEKDDVTPQSIKIVQYLRRIGKRPGSPWANATELAKHLAPDAQCIASGRRSIENRMHRLRQICDEYHTKPLFIKSGSLWRINTDLTFWDRVGFMPSYHDRKGHKQGH